MAAGGTTQFYSDPIFDFSSSLSNHEICDCVLRVDGDEIPAHRIILANSSDFFMNAFTSGMQEAEQNIVEITYNPGNVFPKVLEFIYSGRIDFDPPELVPLLAVAAYYSIGSLTECLDEIMAREIRADNLIPFVQQCYEMGLQEALNALVPVIRRFVPDIPMDLLTHELDVRIFAQVVKGMQIRVTTKTELLNSFLGEHVPDEDEVKALEDAIGGQTWAEIRPVWR
jgi:hypothetical protein